MFKFSFGDDITKELILSKTSEETIFCYYCGFKQLGKKLFKSPLRPDNHPTCSFFRSNSGTLLFHDFATNDILDCFNFVMRLYNVSYYEALKIIANDLNIVSSNISSSKFIPKAKPFIEKDHSKIQIEYKDFTKYELEYWNQYGITLKTLNKFKVYSCRSVFLNDRLFSVVKHPNLAFGYYGGKLKGEELWRIYYPLNKSNGNIRFLTNWPGKKIQGFEMLPNNGNILCITKSMKDVMLFSELGIPSIAPCSETQFISSNVINQLKERFKYIVVLYDNDYTGISFMNKQKKLFPDLIYTWIPRKYECKDITDFYKKYGKIKTQTLIIKFLKWLKENR